MIMKCLWKDYGSNHCQINIIGLNHNLKQQKTGKAGLKVGVSVYSDIRNNGGKNVSITWTNTQKQRLMELKADLEFQNRVFVDKKSRDTYYQQIETQLVCEHKEALLDQKDRGARPVIQQIEDTLIASLTQAGFGQVSTPLIISKNSLEKMTISQDSPLAEQVFWLDHNKCLRPMLAPNLYSIMIDLYRIWGEPVRIFEIGPCFRKESQGKYHLNEFTMLNLVQMGVPEGAQEEILQTMISLVMRAVRITDFQIEKSSSEVYGETIDVVVGDLELCSGAYGPLPLDHLWGVFTPWVGLGLGLERLAMVVEGHRTIKKVGRSLSYLYGHRLNI